MQAPKLAEMPDALTEPEFWALFSPVEHEQLEFKRGVTPSEVQEAIAAMSMTDGGLVVLGVRDSDREITARPFPRTLSTE